VDSRGAAAVAAAARRAHLAVESQEQAALELQTALQVPL
jgi:hypothetical protein